MTVMAQPPFASLHGTTLPQPLPTYFVCPTPLSRSITVDDMRVEEMTAAHYLAFKEKLVPMEAGEH